MRVSRDDWVELDEYFVDSEGEQEIISKYHNNCDGNIDDEEYSYRKHMLNDDESDIMELEEEPSSEDEYKADYSDDLEMEIE